MQFITKSRRDGRGNAGFSVVEILVAATVTSLTLGVLGAFFVASRGFVQQETLRVETTQALRATIDAVTRDLRLSGACLPTNGQFVSLSGVNSGTLDQVTSRTGLLNTDLSCVRTTLTAAASASDSRVTVASITGFAAGTRVYVRNPNGTGELFNISSISSSNMRLNKSGTLTQAYPIGSGVFAVDERSYAIDTTTNPALPQLTVALSANTPTPFASGIESMNIQYQLERNCPTCDVVDLPANDAEWALVRQVLLNVTARSSVTGTKGQYVRVSHQIGVKPRNLVPK
jgi:type II secretory pathway pseudopilin PulG